MKHISKKLNGTGFEEVNSQRIVLGADEKVLKIFNQEIVGYISFAKPLETKNQQPMKKAKRSALIITIIYFSISGIIFSMGGLPDIVILKQLEPILIFPALISFGVGFGGGATIGILATIIAFIIAWVFFWILMRILGRS